MNIDEHSDMSDQSPISLQFLLKPSSNNTIETETFWNSNTGRENVRSGEGAQGTKTA